MQDLLIPDQYRGWDDRPYSREAEEMELDFGSTMFGCARIG